MIAAPFSDAPRTAKALAAFATAVACALLSAAANSQTPPVATKPAPGRDAAVVTPYKAPPPVPSATRVASTPSSDDAASPLRLGVENRYLTSARLGAPYKSDLVASGGRPGYRFSLVGGSLPPGVMLRDNGMVDGKPEKVGMYKFRVRVSDNGLPPTHVEGEFSLRVVPPPTPGAPTTPAVPTLNKLERADSDALVASASLPKVTAYMFTEDDLKILMKPPEPAPEAAPATEADTATATAEGSKPPETAKAKPAPDPRAKQRAEMLGPLLNIEFPSRSLFERALDARLCSYVQAIANEAARKKSTAGVQVVAPKINCPPARPAPAANAVDSEATEVSLDALPLLLLPDATRTQSIELAAKPHLFHETAPIQWVAREKCGCVEDMRTEVYGFYPFWAPDGKEQTIDFSLLTHIGYFGMTFDDDGNFAAPLHWQDNKHTADFLRLAQRHRTKVDLVLYRHDWTQVLADEAKLERIIRQLPRNALRSIDAPLTDWVSTLKGAVPFSDGPPTMGQGLTVWFDGVKEADAAKFSVFFHKFMLTLIAEMRASHRNYSLSIVVPDHLIGGNKPYDFVNLFEYLIKAEDPPISEGRITANFDKFQRETNLDIQFLVLLSSPTTDSKKVLRLMAEHTPVLKGNNRKFFLRNLVPVISLIDSNDIQFTDDLIYAQDNFGGIGLWRTPWVDGEAGPGTAVYKKVRNVFVDAPTAPLCGLMCVWRWEGRALLLVLVVLGIASYAWRFANCKGASRSPWYTAWLVVGGLVTVPLFWLMLNCDPGMTWLYDLMFSMPTVLAVTGALAAWNIWQARKPRWVNP